MPPSILIDLNQGVGLEINPQTDTESPWVNDAGGAVEFITGLGDHPVNGSVVEQVEYIGQYADPDFPEPEVFLHSQVEVGLGIVTVYRTGGVRQDVRGPLIDP